MARVVRPPAVAGVFYPAGAAALRAELRRQLDAVPAAGDAVPPKAIIVPHAGLRYSGAVAACAYARAAPLRGVVRTVVLLGPAHYGGGSGISLSGADAFASPLGALPVDPDATARVLGLSCARVRDGVHAPEHCLEVQLPFVQLVLGDVAILPALAGRGAAGAGEAVLDALWDGDATLLVVSSDLSHYLDDTTARARDRRTAAAVEALDADAIPAGGACGREAVQALLRVARRSGLTARTVALGTSADAGGDRDRVVGYGAFVLGARSER